MNTVMKTRALIVLATVGISICYLNISEGSDQPVAKEKPSMTKANGKITLLVGEKSTTIEVTQYTGLGPRGGFIIESQSQLSKVASSYGYDAPPVDFENHTVLFVRPSDSRCVSLDVDMAVFKNGQLEGVIATQMNKGTQPQPKEPFTFVLLPKDLLK